MNEVRIALERCGKLETYVGTQVAATDRRRGVPQLRLKDRRAFLEKLYADGFDGQGLICGFNLPFDLSRLLESGWVDGRNDGGIDGVYVTVSGQLIQDSDGAAWPRRNATIDVWIITTKHHATFLQAPLEHAPYESLGTPRAWHT
jgi:hypothetical protein